MDNVNLIIKINLFNEISVTILCITKLKKKWRLKGNFGTHLIFYGKKNQNMYKGIMEKIKN